MSVCITTTTGTRLSLLSARARDYDYDDDELFVDDGYEHANSFFIQILVLHGVAFLTQFLVALHCTLYTNRRNADADR